MIWNPTSSDISPYYSYFSFLPQTVQCWTAYIIKINHLVKWLIFNTVKGTEIPVVTILLRFQGKANFTHGVQFGCFRLCIRFSVILRYSIKWLELRFYEMSKNSCLDTNYITSVRHRMSGFFFLGRLLYRVVELHRMCTYHSTNISHLGDIMSEGALSLSHCQLKFMLR